MKIRGKRALLAVVAGLVLAALCAWWLVPAHTVAPRKAVPAESGTAESGTAGGSAAVAGGTVDASTITGKFLFGYQGWHQCPTDGSPNAGWRKWFSGTPPTGPLIDFWPDTSELTAAEKCDTGLTLPNGQPAYLFSDYNAQTVLRHFQWMKQYGIDGVMLQRFASELANSKTFAERNQVTENVMASAHATGRTFDIMYDISGQDPTTLVKTLEDDWKYLVDTLRVTGNPRYLQQNGRPVVAIWGFGFANRPGTPDDLRTLLDFFHNNANPAYRATVMGGVNVDWRTNSTWASALTGFDIISPWSVTRYRMTSSSDTASVKRWVNENTAPDLAYAKKLNKLYLPVVWPGYSFHNQNPGSAGNLIRRYGGNFLWQQAYYTLQAEEKAGMPRMLYGAMFDEVNEGTAIFKQATTSDGWPPGLAMVPLDADGYTQLPSDWYLRVAGRITEMTDGAAALSQRMTIVPH